MTQVLYGNGAKVVRGYDNADRPTSIEHRGPWDQVLLSVRYVWNLDNTLASRTEYDATVSPAQTAVVSFEYDNRGRLVLDSASRCQGRVWEQRVLDGSQELHNITYDYDLP